MSEAEITWDSQRYEIKDDVRGKLGVTVIATIQPRVPMEKLVCAWFESVSTFIMVF